MAVLYHKRKLTTSARQQENTMSFSPPQLPATTFTSTKY